MISQPLFQLIPISRKNLLLILILNPLLQKVSEPEHFGAFLLDGGLAVFELGIPEGPPHGRVGV